MLACLNACVEEISKEQVGDVISDATPELPTSCILHYDAILAVPLNRAKPAQSALCSRKNGAIPLRPSLLRTGMCARCSILQHVGRCCAIHHEHENTKAVGTSIVARPLKL